MEDIKQDLEPTVYNPFPNQEELLSKINIQSADKIEIIGNTITSPQYAITHQEINHIFCTHRQIEETNQQNEQTICSDKIMYLIDVSNNNTLSHVLV